MCVRNGFFKHVRKKEIKKMYELTSVVCIRIYESVDVRVSLVRRNSMNIHEARNIDNGKYQELGFVSINEMSLK